MSEDLSKIAHGTTLAVTAAITVMPGEVEEPGDEVWRDKRRTYRLECVHSATVQTPLAMDILTWAPNNFQRSCLPVARRPNDGFVPRALLLRPYLRVQRLIDFLATC